MWELQSLDGVKKRLKNYQKKWSHEMKNVFDNLETVLQAVTDGARAEQVKKLGFVHSEPNEVLAIDQKGPGKGAKMKEFRLYLYLEEGTHTIHVISLGDKSTQSDDIAFSSRYVRGIQSQQDEEFSTDAEAG